MNSPFLPTLPPKTVHMGGYEHARPEQIVLCKGDSNYTHVHFADGHKITVATTLKIIQARLASRDFVRVNRSGLINKVHIALYTHHEVTLTNGTVLQIARRRRQAVHRFMESVTEIFCGPEISYA